MRATRASAFTISSFYEASTFTAAMCCGVAIFGYNSGHPAVSVPEPARIA
jgi:hypothetical protein